MQRDISGFMVVDVTAPSNPGFLISESYGFTSDFNKGSVFKSLEKTTEFMLEASSRRPDKTIRTISLTAVQFDLVDDTVAEDTLIESIKAKLTADELRIIRRHIQAS
jgi:hypothetical protein